MVAAKSGKTATLAAKSKTAAVTKAKAVAAAKAKRTNLAQKGVTIRLSLAETVHLPYRPTSFKVRDMRRVIADVKRAQG